MLPLGVLAASGAGGIDYEPIATVLVSTATGSIAFNSIPNTYKHLVIRLVSRNDNGGATASLGGLRLNGDTASNYSSHNVGSNASGTLITQANANRSFMPTGYAAGSAATTSAFGVSIIELLDYTNTNKNKTTRTIQSMIHSVSASNLSFTQIMSGAWLNTAAVTSVTLFDANGYNFTAGTRATLYGIKG